MTIGIIGRKRGMTRIFTEDGHSVPVTVIEAQNNRVAGFKDIENNGYKSIQIAWGNKKTGHINKAQKGILTKSSIDSAEGLIEFRLKEGECGDLNTGSELKVDLFESGQKVDVSGESIGKGFAGTIKRYNFSMGGATHGNSLSHRSAGSIGQCQTPGRVFKGKKMSGQMGNVNRTVQNLEIVKVDSERNLLLIKGAVPGAKGGRVIVKPAIKQKIKVIQDAT